MYHWIDIILLRYSHDGLFTFNEASQDLCFLRIADPVPNYIVKIKHVQFPCGPVFLYVGSWRIWPEAGSGSDLYFQEQSESELYSKYWSGTLLRKGPHLCPKYRQSFLVGTFLLRMIWSEPAAARLPRLSNGWVK